MATMWMFIRKCEILFISTITDKAEKAFRKFCVDGLTRLSMRANIQVNVSSNRNPIPWIMVKLQRQQCWTKSSDTITRRKQQIYHCTWNAACVCVCVTELGALGRCGMIQKVVHKRFLNELPPLCIFGWRNCGKSQRFASLRKLF